MDRVTDSAAERRAAANAPPPRLVWLGIAAAGALLLWRLSDIVMVVLLAALLAIMLRGCADWLAARTRLPPLAMLALLAIGLVLLFAALCAWIGPRVLAQGQELVGDVAGGFDQLRAHLAATHWGRPIAAELTGGSAMHAAQRLLGPAGTALVLTFSSAADLVLLCVTTLYLALAPEVYVSGLLRFVPAAHRTRAHALLARLTRTLRQWMLGQLLDMLTVAVLAAAGLSLAGVPDPYALAVLAGLLTFIPYVGAVIAAIPALIVALAVGWGTALWTLVVFLVCHGAEGYIVAPLVQRRLVNLPPAVIIISLACMGTLFGPLGVILGTPTAAVCLVLLQEFYFDGRA
jgi:predicted PurR-regulated permease PerM